MSDVINLNQMRKAKAKADKEKTAAGNRAKFGRTKGEKKLEETRAEKAKKLLDAHEREKNDE